MGKKAENTRLLESMHQISLSVLDTPSDVDKLLDDLAEKVLLLGVFRSLMIALVDWSLEEVRVVRSFSRWNQKLGILDKIELVPHSLDLVYSLDDENITAVAAKSGRLQVIEEWDERLDSRVDKPSYRRGQMAYFIPIMHGGRSVAVLATASLLAEKEATLRRIERLQPLLDQVGMALVQARLFAEFNKSNEDLRKEIARRQEVEEELRLSESKWRLLSAHIPDFVAVIDADGCVLSANRPFDAAVGEEQVCESVCQCEGLGNGPLIKGWIDLVFGTGEDAHFEISTADSSDGVSREFSIIALGEESEKTRAIFIARDISLRKLGEQQLVRLDRLRVQSELTAGVSHNLNNILTGVLLPAQMLKRALKNEREIRDIDDVIKSAQRARDLVERLRRSTSQPQVEPLQSVCVKSAIEDAVLMTKPHWQDKAHRRGIDIELKLNISADIPPICGEENGLREIVASLLLNACDALPSGGRIAVEGHAVGDEVCICVSDTGVGIDAAIQPYIFDPFFTTKNIVGAGFGLSTLRAMIAQWNGRVEVKSASGAGAYFMLYLPVWDSAELVNATDVAGLDMRVLVVDDEELVCDSLRRVLVGVARVETAASGYEALEAFAPNRFDVALIDLAMPDMAGDRLARELRRLDSRIALVLLTGLEVPEGDMRRAPFDEFLQKPCSPEEIFASLTRMTELYRGSE